MNTIILTDEQLSKLRGAVEDKLREWDRQKANRHVVQEVCTDYAELLVAIRPLDARFGRALMLEEQMGRMSFEAARGISDMLSFASCDLTRYQSAAICGMGSHVARMRDATICPICSSVGQCAHREIDAPDWLRAFDARQQGVAA